MNLKTIKNNIEKILKKECYKNNITRRDIEFCLLESIQKNKSFLLTHDDYDLTHNEQNKLEFHKNSCFNCLHLNALYI